MCLYHSYTRQPYCVVLQLGMTANQVMIDHFKAGVGVKLPRYKRSGRLYLLEEIPHMTTGKARHSKLRGITAKSYSNRIGTRTIPHHPEDTASKNVSLFFTEVSLKIQLGSLYM